MRKQSSSSLPRVLRAVGYVRVSTDIQAQEGVSLEAQQVRIKAHCVSQEITLVEMISDEGYSAKTLERPGLQRALAMLKAGKADAIVVVKLDRLTRSVKDLGTLCDSYFREGMPFSLLSVSDSIDTRSAGGKLLLNVLMSVAQWEREAISERTQEAMDELKRQGVTLGGAPFGWKYSEERDANGRKTLAEDPAEQKAIRRICELHRAGLSVMAIYRRLVADKIPARPAKWERPTIYRILMRQGLVAPPKEREPRDSDKRKGKHEPNRDKRAAIERAHKLRAQGLSLRKIASQLQKERILPARTDVWHPASVLDLLRQPVATFAA